MENIYVKLNDTGGVFFDPNTGITVSGNNVVEVEVSERVSSALKNGHLRRATPEEIETVSKSESTTTVSSALNTGTEDENKAPEGGESADASAPAADVTSGKKDKKAASADASAPAATPAETPAQTEQPQA